MVTATDYTDWDPSDKDRKEIEKCVLARYKDYAERYDDDLWFIFKNNFEEWTADDLKKCSIQYLADLREILRTNGVYVPKRGPPMKALIDTLAQPEFHEWTESEVVQHVQLKGTVNSPSIQLQFGVLIKRLNDVANAPIQNNARFAQADTPSPPSANLHGMVTRARAPAGGLQNTTPPAETAPPAPQAPLAQAATPPTQTATTWQGTGYVPATPGMETNYAVTTAAATPGQERTYSLHAGQFAPLYANGIAQLRKVYTTDSTKYGDNEDSFDLAHNIFLDLCRQMGLHTAEARNQAFSVMLKGLALDYYYTWKDQWERMGIDPAVAVKSHFENDEHLRKVQADWDTINLYTVIVKYPEKSITECLGDNVPRYTKALSQIATRAAKRGHLACEAHLRYSNTSSMPRSNWKPRIYNPRPHAELARECQPIRRYQASSTTTLRRHIQY
jgi:hypothetical protein